MPRSPGRILMLSTHGYVSASPELGKPDTGGQVVYVLELSKTLASMGYRVDILTRRFDNQPAEEMVTPGVRVIREACGGSRFIEKERLVQFIPELVDGMLTRARREGLRYEWLNSHYWDAGVAGEFLADRWDVPHIHTPHSLGAWKRDQMQGTAVDLDKSYNFTQRIATERSLYHNADGVVATTGQQREILQGADYELPRSRVRVIPPGFDDRRFFPVAPPVRTSAKEQLRWRGKTILALGRIAANKGYDLLIKALPTVIKRCPDARLVLAIGGKILSAEERQYVDELEQMAAWLGMQDRVSFVGYVPDARLADVYRAADVFVLSSRYEPFGMTAIEAMACGTPTIVTTEGGLWRELVWGRDALYVDPRDPPALGHTIVNVLRDSRIWRRLSSFGVVRAQQRYTWQSVAERIARYAEKSRVERYRTSADHPFSKERATA